MLLFFARYTEAHRQRIKFCARALEMTIGKQDAVKAINVNLKDKVITINFNDNQRLEDSVISQLINDAGYTVREITDEKN